MPGLTLRYNSRLAVFRTACIKLGVDAQTAADEPQFPIAAMEQYWLAFIRYEQYGSRDCVNGINTSDAWMVAQSIYEMNSANVQHRKIVLVESKGSNSQARSEV